MRGLLAMLPGSRCFLLPFTLILGKMNLSYTQEKMFIPCADGWGLPTVAKRFTVTCE